jgi:hypothetical protein
MLIKDTEPSYEENPQEPFLSERELTTKSPLQTFFLLSPLSVFTAVDN